MPLHYFRHLREAGIEAWLVAHERNLEELKAANCANEYSRIHFAKETKAMTLLWRITDKMPERIKALILESSLQFMTQRSQRKIIRKLIPEVGATVVHQPTPVSPKMPSLMFRLGAPVVIGPMNGGMRYPPAFRHRQSILERMAFKIARGASALINRLIPGKRYATALLVANERTRLALPPGLPRPIAQVSENGIDTEIWHANANAETSKNQSDCAHFIFIGRLVALKAVDLLFHALSEIKKSSLATVKLEILGNGPELPALETLACELGIEDDVTFHGFKSQTECALLLSKSDALVLPSLHECGGAVVLEAMAMGKAVIATNWGGPADYLDDTCGILIQPDGRQELIRGFADAITKLANEPTLTDSLGRAGKKKVMSHFDWRIKIKNILAIYDQAIAMDNKQADE